jgi:hypothetical protein
MSLTYPESRIQADDEKQELQTVLQSGILKRAPNLQHFLEFVAEEYFAGNADQIKEYSIAVHALHRPEKFDPQSDTIVRVTAHALRKKLEQYYATDGAGHKIQIHLPAGKYVLQFIRKPQEFAPQLDNPAPTFGFSPLVEPLPLQKRRRWPKWVAIGVGVAAIVGALGIDLARQRQHAPAAKPSAPAPVAGTPQDSVMRIRFGGSTHPYRDAAGQLWISEQFCKGGTVFAHTDREIQGTDDPAIFREGREGKTQCRIPVPPGVYQLQLLFADTASDKEGARQVVFAINNKPPEALDIVDEAGGNDIVVGKVYAGIRPMSDGAIHLDFLSDGAFVNALELTPALSAGSQPMRMMAGPAVLHDDGGKTWLPERFFVGGRRAFHLDNMQKTTNAKLFQWERYGHFHYLIPVVAGTDYSVRLYFSEGWFGTDNGGPGGIGSRVFDVYCNGTTLLKDFDISKEQKTGGIVITTHHVKPTAHGMLELYFTPVRNYPLINAIEVTPEE